MKYQADDGTIYETDANGEIKAGDGTALTQISGPTQPPEETFSQKAGDVLSQAYKAFSATADPAQAARSQEAARILNLPVRYSMLGASADVQKAALDKAQQIKNSPTDWTTFVKNFPATSNYLASGANMAVSHDDIHPLSSIEWITQNMSAGLQQSELERQRAELEEPIFSGMANGIKDLAPDAQKKITDLTNQIGVAQSKVTQDPWSFAGVAANIASLGSMLPGAAKYGTLGMVGGAILGSAIPVVGTALGATAGRGIGADVGVAKYFGDTGASSYYHDQISQGVDTNTARHGAEIVRAINTGIGLIGVPELAKMIPGGSKILNTLIGKAVADVVASPDTRAAVVKTAVAQIAKSVATMAGMSGGMTAGNEAAGKITGTNNDTFGQAMGNIGESALSSIPAGLAFGLIPGGATMLKGHERLAESDKQQAIIKILGDAIEASKTSKIAPDNFEDFMNHATQGTPVENLFIPAARLVEYFQNQHPEDPTIVDKKAAELGISPEHLNEAINSEGDLTIPTAKAASVLGGTPDWKGLSQDIKFAPDAMTGREEAEHAQSITQGMAEAAPGSEPTTYDSWKQKLEDAGVKGAQADHVATLMSAFGGRMEDLAGIKAEDLVKAVGVEKEKSPGLMDKARTLAQSVKDKFRKEEGSSEEGMPLYQLSNESKAPEKTTKSYKLFRTDARRPGELFPLFVDANKSIPVGKWVDAVPGPLTENGKVKSKLGELAYRPGFHSGDLPVATHIGGKSTGGLSKPDYRPENQVWAEVEVPNDVDWQTEADRRGVNDRGKHIPVKAHITDQLPVGGHYRYKTNPNMTGNWLISGSMRINRVLSDAEVKAINDAHGVADLPRNTDSSLTKTYYQFSKPVIEFAEKNQMLSDTTKQVLGVMETLKMLDGLIKDITKQQRTSPEELSTVFENDQAKKAAYEKTVDQTNQIMDTSLIAYDKDGEVPQATIDYLFEHKNEIKNSGAVIKDVAGKEIATSAQIANNIGQLTAGHARGNAFEISKAIQSDASLKDQVLAAQDQIDKLFGETPIVKPDGSLVSTPIEQRMAKFKDTGEENPNKPQFGGFARTLSQTFLDFLPEKVFESVRGDLTRAVEHAYANGGNGIKGVTFFDKHLDTVSKSDFPIAAAVSKAEKTVGSLNLSSACPEFMIGGHGCYLDGCYVTGMGMGGNTISFYNRAAYTGELLQLSNADVGLLNKIGGLRLNGQGDLTGRQYGQLKDVIRHAEMRGLKLKIITKQDATLEMLHQMHKEGQGIGHIQVQMSIDPYWVPISEDDIKGSMARAQGVIQSWNRSGLTNKHLVDGMIELYAKSGQEAKVINGMLYRKYGYSVDKAEANIAKYPEISIQPRVVVGTPEEIVDFTRNHPKYLQTWMHAAIRPGMFSDVPTEEYPNGKVLGKGELGNFTSRIAIFQDETGWHIQAQAAAKNSSKQIFGLTKDLDNRRKDLIKAKDPVRRDSLHAEMSAIQKQIDEQSVMRAEDIKTEDRTAYTRVEDFIKQQPDAEQIFATLKGELDKNPSALCCSAGADKDACNNCTSNCHMGSQMNTGPAVNVTDLGIVASGVTRTGEAIANNAGKTNEKNHPGPVDTSAEAEQQKTIRSGSTKSVSYLQESGNPLGSYTPGQGLGGIIRLFGAANKSTVIHEAAHMFLDTIDKLSNTEGATDELKGYNKTIRDWVGAKDGEELTVEQHEKFARAFEQYTMDGKAPSMELVGAFAKFRSWLTSVYKRAVGMGAEVSPEIRGVFDRMLSSEEDTKQMEAAQGYGKFLGRDMKPKDYEVYQRMADKAHETAVNEVLKKRMSEIDPETQARANFHAEKQREDIEHQVANDPARLAAAKLEEQHGGRNIANLVDEFKNNRLSHEQHIWLDLTAKEQGFADEATMFKAIGNLKSFSQDVAGRIEQAKEDYLRNELGLDGNESVEAIHNPARLEAQGMEAEILRQMIHDKIDKSGKDADYSRREAEANQRWKDAEQKLMDEYGKSKKEELQQKIDELGKKHKEDLTKLKKDAEMTQRWTDAETWSKAKQEQAARAAEIGIKAAREMAKNILNSKIATEAIDWRKQFMLERKNRAKCEKLAAKGDYEGALKAKNAEMLCHALGLEGIKAEREYKGIQKFLTPFVKRGQDLMKMRPDFAYQISRLLNQVGLVADEPTLPEGQFSPESLAAFLTRTQDEYVNPVVPDSIMAGPMKFTNMSLGDARDLKIAIKSLHEVGRNIEKTLAGEVKKELVAICNEMAEEAFNELGVGRGDKGIGSKRTTLMEELGKKLNPFEKVLAYVYPENICRLLSGGKDNGSWQRYLFRPIFDAVMGANMVSRQTTKDILEIFDRHGMNMTDIVRMGNDMRQFDFLPTRKVSMETILMAAMHWGNSEGRDRVIRSILFGTDPGMPISHKLSYVDEQRGSAAAMQMFRELTPKHAEFIKDFQNYLGNSKWDQIRHQEITINGFDPKRVEALPWDLNGTQMPGGYAHINYDPEKSSEAYYSAEALNATYAQFPGVRAATDHGFTKGRVRAVNRDLDLDFQSQLTHLANVDYDLAMRKPIIDAARILKNSSVRAAVENSLGQGYLRQLDQWLKNVAIDQRQPMNSMEKILRGIQGNTTRFTLGLNVKALPDFLPNNIIQAMSQAGLDGAIASAQVAKYIYDGDFRDNIKWKSPMMAQRLTLCDKNIDELSRKVLNGGLLSQLPDAIPSGAIDKADNMIDVASKVSMSFHGIVDCMISFPIWDQMYNKSIDAGMAEHEAVGIADSYVRRVMGDGSSVGQPTAMKDPSVAGRLMGMFLTYQVGQFNRFWFDSKLGGLEFSKGNYAQGIGLMTKAIALGWIAPALWTSMVRVGMPLAGAGLLATGISGMNQQGKMDNKEKAKEYALDAAKQPFSGFRYYSVVTNYAVNAIEGNSLSDLQFSPAEGAVEEGIKDLLRVGKYFVKSGPKPSGEGEKTVDAAAKLALLSVGAPKRLDTWALNYYDWLNKNGDRTVNQAIRDVFSREHKQKGGGN